MLHIKYIYGKEGICSIEFGNTVALVKEKHILLLENHKHHIIMKKWSFLLQETVLERLESGQTVCSDEMCILTFTSFEKLRKHLDFGFHK